jgi:hypothetical protein
MTRSHRLRGVLGQRAILRGVKSSDWDRDLPCSAVRIQDTVDGLPCRSDAPAQEFRDPSGKHRCRGKRDG